MSLSRHSRILSRHSRESGDAACLHTGFLRPVDSRLRGNDVLLFLSLAFLLAAPAFAQSAMPPARYAYAQLEDPKQEAEARALMETLRCLVCQGQSIADSDADMAGDMRALVRERIAAGEEPEAIRSWLVDRYGAWVSYKPTVEPLTWPLWAAPIVLLALGLWLARGRFRRKAR